MIDWILEVVQRHSYANLRIESALLWQWPYVATGSISKALTCAPWGERAPCPLAIPQCGMGIQIDPGSVVYRLRTKPMCIVCLCVCMYIECVCVCLSIQCVCVFVHAFVHKREYFPWSSPAPCPFSSGKMFKGSSSSNPSKKRNVWNALLRARCISASQFPRAAFTNTGGNFSLQGGCGCYCRQDSLWGCGQQPSADAISWHFSG